MKENAKNNFQIIETESELENITKIIDIDNEKIIAFDLESDSMFHFKEKVCLIQMAVNSLNIVIDPLKINDLSPLKPVFANREIKKVFHGADYDVRSLHRDFNFKINNLFDTELACRFLGMKETGLNTVLNKRFQVSLDKKYQKKDWSKRPLPPEMLEYAAGDVAHLVALARVLEKELLEMGRLSWVVEESDNLSNVRFENANGEPLFTKFKGAGRLDRRELAVLESLLLYRVELAKKKDRPLFKIIGNGPLLKMAKSRPSSLNRLQRLEILSHRQISMYGENLVHSIKSAMNIPEDNLPRYPRRRSPPVKPRVAKRIKALKEWRERKGESLKIEAGFLVNKSLLNCIAEKNPHDMESLDQVHGMSNWQKIEFGEDIVRVLREIS